MIKERFRLLYLNGHGRKMFLMNSGEWVNETVVRKSSIKEWKSSKGAANRKAKQDPLFQEEIRIDRIFVYKQDPLFQEEIKIDRIFV